MTDEEISRVMPLLADGVWPPTPKPKDEADDQSSWFTGIEDRYHDLMVGPCDLDVAEREACALVWKFFVTTLDEFDCTFAEWSKYLRLDVLRAIEDKSWMATALSPDHDVAALVQQAKTEGLDGTKIVARDDGWVVARNLLGCLPSYLTDPEEASWVIGDDDLEMRPAVFRTAEEAFRAWARSEEVGKARAQRRESALKRLGKPPR